MEPRFYVAFLWFAFLLGYVISAIRSLCLSTGLKASPWLLPLLTGEPGDQMFIIIGALILFCDAPFLHSDSGWQILRAGRKSWFWGNMLYIWCLSLVYALGLALIPILMMLPYVQGMSGWGKILGALAQTSAAAQLGISNLDYNIMVQYAPVQAMVLTVLPIWLNAVLIGMVNFTFNLFWKQGAGAAVSTMIGLSPLLLIKLANYRFAYYISPPLWMNLAYYRYKGYGAGVSFVYAYSILLLLITVCMTVSYVGIRRKDLIMIEEV